MKKKLKQQSVSSELTYFKEQLTNLHNYSEIDFEDDDEVHAANIREESIQDSLDLLFEGYDY